jgi:NTP pyrophosphatase (non-canonical NTP hydrolase)
LDLNSYIKELRAFAERRDWDRFHSPKNLAMGVASEAGELLDIFQWLSEDESRRLQADFPVEYAEARKELADVCLHLLRLVDKLDIDLEAALEEKMRLNAEKYPVELAHGNATKYRRRTEDESGDNGS